MRVSVAVAWPERQEVIELDLPDGSTVADALVRVQAMLPEARLAGLRTGIWSRPCPPETRLREGDRVELYRALVADAKAMRRARVRRRK
jgi:putative ubiquitin-RnfH superfamily antitoxin RatB of RatAB toxin-antitoxin module